MQQLNGTPACDFSFKSLCSGYTRPRSPNTCMYSSCNRLSIHYQPCLSGHLGWATHNKPVSAGIFRDPMSLPGTLYQSKIKKHSILYPPPQWREQHARYALLVRKLPSHSKWHESFYHWRRPRERSRQETGPGPSYKHPWYLASSQSTQLVVKNARCSWQVPMGNVWLGHTFLCGSFARGVHQQWRFRPSEVRSWCNTGSW